MTKFYFITLFTIISFALSAQEKATFSKHFISFRTGYSIPVVSSQIGSPRSEVGKTYINTEETSTGDVISYSEKNSFGSRGAGLNFSLGYGFMITQNFSFEVDFNYLYTLGFDDAYVNRRTKSDKVIYHATQKSQTSMFRITPMFGVYANESLLIRPYAKFGILMPLAGGTSVKLSIEDETGDSFRDLMPVIDPETVIKTARLIEYINTEGGLNIQNRVPTKTDIEAVTSGSFSIGFMARLGAEYKFKNVLDGKLKIFAEMEMQMLTVKAKQTKINKFYSTVNSDALKGIVNNQELLDGAGIDFIQSEFTEADIPEILLTTDYLNEITESSNSSFETKNPDGTANPNYNRDKAYEQLTFRDNYNAFAFMIGLKYNF
ncbi:MAG: hypothetical protein ACPGVH_00695 [Chitinophagales bacterium]